MVANDDPVVAQTESRDMQREGQSVGGAGLFMASPLSHLVATDVACLSRSSTRLFKGGTPDLHWMIPHESLLACFTP
jgi:hypothetical protein